MKEKRPIKILNNIISLIMISVMLTSIILSFVSIYYRSQERVMFLFGYSISYVVSDSMNPLLNVGDAILNKEMNDIEKLQEGDIITYRSQEGITNGKLITHRIVEVNDTGETVFLRTQGDSNAAMDLELVEEEQIVGIFDRRLSVLSFILKALLRPIAFFIVILVPLSIVFVLQAKKIPSLFTKKQ